MRFLIFFNTWTGDLGTRQNCYVFRCFLLRKSNFLKWGQLLYHSLRPFKSSQRDFLKFISLRIFLMVFKKSKHSVTFPEACVIYLPLWLLYLQNKMNYSLVRLLFCLVRMVSHKNYFLTFFTHLLLNLLLFMEILYLEKRNIYNFFSIKDSIPFGLNTHTAIFLYFTWKDYSLA